MFSSCFHFDLFLSGVVLSSRRIMAFSSNDKENTPPEDDHQDLQLKKKLKVRTRKKRWKKTKVHARAP
jgi:hypothetical protein